jgi:hypothetical protein
MSDYLSVSEAAARIGAKPKDLSDAIYLRKIDAERCPLIAGRRVIPVDYLDGIAIELRRMGKLPPLRGTVRHVQ